MMVVEPPSYKTVDSRILPCRAAAATMGQPTGTSFMDVRTEMLRERLNQLKQQHRDFDAAITSLELTGTADQLQLRRLKKQKLLLKDQIAEVEDQMLPDIIA
jgi:hypothetical protein